MHQQSNPNRMTSYMYTPDLASTPAIMPDTLPFSFPLDPFQKHAVSAIHQGHNVLVCAKTGSGKTLVGEYQIEHTLSKGKRIFYTTPIKSLSNQKFHDLKEAYGKRASVGILTGDIKFCPDADIIVMTTEILRNLLYKKGSATEHIGLTASLSLDGLDAVIFDECHYINDRDRGKVWEETMILLPPEVKLVMLSATLDHPELFASWLGQLKETPIALIQTSYRIVPLTHTIKKGNEFITIMDAAETFYDKTYSDWLKERDAVFKAADDFKDKVKSVKGTAGSTDHKGSVSGKVRPTSFLHQMNETVDLLNSKNLLPAIFFVLSRKACELYASKVSATLLNSSETAALSHIISFHLHSYKGLETLPQFHTIRDLLLRGIAFHHSGLLPVLKEIVELAFTKGYVKLLFATETFAVGLNMPTKTVIFTGLHKYDTASEGMRPLRTDEYTQMAGRAGRRGKDTFGLVVYLPDREPVSTSEMRAIMKGSKQQVESRMDFHYDFLLKTLQGGKVKWLQIMENSYWFQQRKKVLAGIKTELDAVSAKISEISLSEEDEKECASLVALEELVVSSVNAKKRDAQRKLTTWLNEHSGSKWSNARRLFGTKRNLLAKRSELAADCSALEAHKDGILPVVEFLKKTKFIASDADTKVEELGPANLTLRGILATEINEGHPILMTELYLSEKAHGLSGEDLISVLAVFMELDEKAEMPSLSSLGLKDDVRGILEWLDDTAYKFQVAEKHCSAMSPVGYWDLTLQWIIPLRRWLAGEHIATICAEHEIFEGNFTRAILKIANLLDEWLALATYCEHVSQIEKIGTLKPLLVRDVVIPDSIYLRI